MATGSIRRPLGWALASICVFAGAESGATLPQAQGDIERAAIIQGFNERLERYVSLRSRLEEPLPPFDGHQDSWSSLLLHRYLASAIRAGRSGAHQGEIFT